MIYSRWKLRESNYLIVTCQLLIFGVIINKIGDLMSHISLFNRSIAVLFFGIMTVLAAPAANAYTQADAQDAAMAVIIADGNVRNAEWEYNHGHETAEFAAIIALNHGFSLCHGNGSNYVECIDGYYNEYDATMAGINDGRNLAYDAWLQAQADLRAAQEYLDMILAALNG